MDNEPGRWVTLGEAAHFFKVSERTMRRRIKAGQLRTQHSGGRVLVLVYGLADSVADKSDTADTSGKWQTLAIERLATIERLENENRNLWAALATAMQNEQRLIEASSQPGAGDPESKTPARRWWKFWKFWKFWKG